MLIAPTVAVAIVLTKVEPVAGFLRDQLGPLDEIEDKHGRGLGGVLMLVIVIGVGISVTTLLGKTLKAITKRTKRMTCGIAPNHRENGASGQRSADLPSDLTRKCLGLV